MYEIDIYVHDIDRCVDRYYIQICGVHSLPIKTFSSPCHVRKVCEIIEREREINIHVCI